ncbi:MAG TPA: ABC transporter permease [bacterium]|nr:ABC transporter permease [bacterium]
MSGAWKRIARLWQFPFLVIGFLFTWFGPFLQDLGGMAIFFVQVWRHMFRRPFEWRELIIQLYQVGVKSLPIVIIAGVFVGAIVAIQFEYALSLFGATQYLGGITTSGLLREVGPVLVSIMIAGRIGAYITAELGTMKVTEQIDAVRCLGADPMQFLVVPRFIAVTLMIFVLTVAGLVVASVGGAVAVYLLRDMGLSYYFANVRSLAAAWALFNGMAKGLFFGLLLSTISCYKGMSTEGGTEGVGKAVNSCLVTSSIAIFLCDYVMASIASITFQVAETLLFFD